jgi:hypothetical protein
MRQTGHYLAQLFNLAVICFGVGAVAYLLTRAFAHAFPGVLS